MPDIAPTPHAPVELTGILGVAGQLRSPETRLYSVGVVLGSDGPCAIGPDDAEAVRISGTAYLDPATPRAAALTPTEADLAAARAEVAAATIPGRDLVGDAADTALLDILACSYRNGAIVAAASSFWRYVWPRDVSHMAVALGVAGLFDRAWAALRFVCSLLEDDGTWEARYLPDGSGRIPDDRGRQLDGNGWIPWAAWTLAQLDPAGLPTDLREPLTRVARAGIASLGENGLPHPSQDYWETDFDKPTLGVCAPLLAGLRAASDLAVAWGDDDLVRSTADAAARLADGIATVFAPHYPRIQDGEGVDAAVAYLLPPFGPADPAVVEVWHRTRESLRVANGGVRPGEEWPDTETAWTPQTSLFAMTAAHLGEAEEARTKLRWLADHTSAWGSLPEKVTADGRPAAVCPLPLTSATVLIALAALEGRPLPTVPTPTDRTSTDSGAKTPADVTDDVAPSTTEGGAR